MEQKAIDETIARVKASDDPQGVLSSFTMKELREIGKAVKGVLCFSNDRKADYVRRLSDRITGNDWNNAIRRLSLADASQPKAKEPTLFQVSALDDQNM